MNKKLIGYITFMEYFATGEGVTNEINFCFASSKEEAIEKHLDKFVGDKKEHRDYFRVDIEVFKSNSKRSKELLSNAFKDGDRIFNHLNKAGIEFYFKFYYNYN